MPAAIRHDDPGRGGTPSQRARRPYDSSGMAVVGILNAVLPPFQLADDDTLCERIPVALALPDVVVDHPDYRRRSPLRQSGPISDLLPVTMSKLNLTHRSCPGPRGPTRKTGLPICDAGRRSPTGSAR